mmetsp:Transcript_172678/g.553432  ORF Transcript_172678/g.553432 Transcript_172678/m.553432 type:complete len:323 (-) Transcript_172678:1478-2446(-)
MRSLPPRAACARPEAARSGAQAPTTTRRRGPGARRLRCARRRSWSLFPSRPEGLGPAAGPAPSPSAAVRRRSEARPPWPSSPSAGPRPQRPWRRLGRPAAAALLVSRAAVSRRASGRRCAAATAAAEWPARTAAGSGESSPDRAGGRAQSAPRPRRRRSQPLRLVRPSWPLRRRPPALAAPAALAPARTRGLPKAVRATRCGSRTASAPRRYPMPSSRPSGAVRWTRSTARRRSGNWSGCRGSRLLGGNCRWCQSTTSSIGGRSTAGARRRPRPSARPRRTPRSSLCSTRSSGCRLLQAFAGWSSRIRCASRRSRRSWSGNC